MDKRLKEILQRKMEIRSALQGAEKVDLSAIEKELKDLEAEEVEIRKKQEIASKINIGTLVPNDVKKPEKENRQAIDMYDSIEYRNAFFEYVKTGKPIPEEFRAANSTVVADAGAVIPTMTLNKIVDKLTSSGMILPLVTQTAYQTGLSIPTSSVKPVATWVADGGGSDRQKKAVGAVVFSANKLRCAVAVSFNLENMSLSAFENAITNNIAEAMVIALEKAIISGTGAGQPKGILGETAPDGQAIEVSKIDYKTLCSIEAAIPTAYETGAVYVMTKKTFMEFVGMTDAQGQPIARINYGINGAADRSLLGRKVVICDYLPNYSAAEAGAVFAFVFRMEDYVLNTNYSIGLKQYEDYETDDQVRKAIMLADGKVVDKNSLVTMAKAAA